MNISNAPDRMLWNKRYGNICLSKNAEIIYINGVGDKDTYNPKLCEYNNLKILSFRCEERKSTIFNPIYYHPSIMFAKQNEAGEWQLTDQILPFDMLEDPLFLATHSGNQSHIIFGGVRANPIPGGFIASTELYQGDSLETLNHIPFAIIKGMKDIRLSQLPDGRFLLCQRPTDKSGNHGRITLHVIDNLQILTDNSIKELPTLAILDSGYPDDWVGTNSAYILHDKKGTEWVGLLSHLGNFDANGNKHYAASIYKIKLEDLLDNQVQKILPKIIATRECFPDGPPKDETLVDVIFPGSLESLGNQEYRLWAGLSDSQIGVLILDDPFSIT